MKRLTYFDYEQNTQRVHFESDKAMNNFLERHSLEQFGNCDVSHFWEEVTFYNKENGLTFNAMVRFESFKDVYLNYNLAKQIGAIIGTMNVSNLCVNGIDIERAIILTDSSEEYHLILATDQIDYDFM